MLTLIYAHAIIVDNIFQKEFISKLGFGDKVHFIPYGSNIKIINTQNTLKELKINPDEYILFVGRFAPEKGADVLIKGFEKTKTNKKLVIVGDDIFNTAYVTELKKTTDMRIIFTGYLYDISVEELMQNCYL